MSAANLLLACLLLLSQGCTMYRTTQRDLDGSGKVLRTTHMSAWSFFDSAAKIQNARVSSTEKTQSTSLAGLEQTASGSNAVTVIKLVIEGAAKSAAPIP